MTDVRIPTLVRVPHPALSLWQSAVAEVCADRLAQGDVASPLVRADPLVQAANAHAHERYTAAREGRDRAVDRHPWFAAILDLVDRVHLGGAVGSLETVVSAVGSYSNRDPAFLKAVLKFLDWYVLLHQSPVYRDWTERGRDIEFGVVEQRLPAGARIGVIGDWGTGLPDARALLEALVAECRPDAIVHLGDVYYSGTPRETACNFAGVLDATFDAIPPRLPVFNLAGNHDYYSGGQGFYERLDTLNAGPARQAASYFCVRTEDDRWQLVGVDTGFNDRFPGIPFDSSRTAPALHDSEREWLRHKLQVFPGRTLLFSHHQLFSAHSALNGPDSGSSRPNFNEALGEAVQPHADRIAMWMWGHEHALAVFADQPTGVARCRLVGCSAFEMSIDDKPYERAFADVAYLQPPVQLAAVNGRYNHGCAVIDLGASRVEYYQFPSWPPGEPPDVSRRLRPMFEEGL